MSRRRSPAVAFGPRRSPIAPFLVLAATASMVALLLALAPTAEALTPTIENAGSNMFEQTVSSRESGQSANRLDINVVVKHDVGKKVTGLKVDTDYNGTDNSSTATTQTADVANQPTVVGGFNYTTAFLSFRNTVSNIPCGDRPGFSHTVYVRPVLSDGTVGNVSSASLFFTPAGGCNFPIPYEDYPFMYGQTNTAPVQLTPGGSATFSWNQDDPDTGNNTQGYAYRFRRLNDGSTTSTTVVCPGDIDNAQQTRTFTFPNQRGHWVVEAELREGSTCADRVYPSGTGGWWRIGSADVNTAQASSPALSLSATRPQINGTTTITATTDDAEDASNGGAPQYIEWDLDNNGTYDDANLGTGVLTGAGDDSDTLTASEKQTTINTTGKAPGTYTVKARVTDNGAMNASDAIRRQTTATTTYLVDTPPEAQDQALEAESGRPLQITLTGTDANSDPLTYSIVEGQGPSSGTLGGSGASRTYTADAAFAGQDSFTFRVDDGFGGTDTATVGITVRPDTRIDSGPSTTEPNGPSGSFTFSSAVESVTFECRLDSTDPNAWEPCASPFQYEDLSQGEHTFAVRARTASGLIDPTPASVTFTVDAVLPDTTIVSGPPARTGSRSAEFEFSGSEDSTFECRLDSEDFTTCGPGAKAYANLADGQHTFEVRAVDGVGQRDPTPASHTWRVDTRAPETEVLSSPSSSTSATEAVFDFRADEPGSTFECRLDSTDPDGWEPCDSPKSYPDLREGRHTFDVRATDAVGNTDPVPDSRAWTVDRTPPDTTLDGGPAGTSRSRDASFELASSEGGSTLQCRIDAGAWRRCSSPVSYQGLDDGAHTLEARATDAAGNTDPEPASRSWVVDATAPQTAIESGPRGTTDSGTATFESSASEAGSTLECRLDGGAWDACETSKTYSGLANGAHTFEVRATDAAGNVDPTPAVRTWTVAVPGRGTSCAETPAQPGCEQRPALTAKVALPKRGRAVDASLSLRSGGSDLRAVTFTFPRDVTVAFARRALGKRAGTLTLTSADGRRLRSVRLALPKGARKSAVLLKARGVRVVLRAGRGGRITVTGLPGQVRGVSLILSGAKSGLLTVPRRCFTARARAVFTDAGGATRTVRSGALGRACPRR